MENLVNKIQEILDINVTSYRISKITGITELVLSKYRKGTYNVKNMSLETADKLISNIFEIEKYAKWFDACLVASRIDWGGRWLKKT